MGHLPEFSDGVFRQQIEIVYRERTGLETLVQRRSPRRIHVERPYALAPFHPTAVLWRLLRGLPVIEPYTYEARILALHACVTR